MSDGSAIYEALACPYVDCVDPPLHSGCIWCAEVEPAFNELAMILEQSEKKSAALRELEPLLEQLAEMGWLKGEQALQIVRAAL